MEKKPVARREAPAHEVQLVPKGMTL